MTGEKDHFPFPARGTPFTADHDLLIRHPARRANLPPEAW